VSRGSALVATVWVIIALTAVVLVLSRTMIVEATVSKQRISMAKCSAAEQGVEQYLLSVVASAMLTPGYSDEISYEQRQLGDCYWWLIKPNPSDPTIQSFGIDDEAARLDLNTATYDQLMLLPYMTDELASSIIDWRDTDDDITGTDGAEDNYYMSLPTPYHCKSAPFESIDELKLVRGATPEILWGLDTNHNGVLEASELMVDNPVVTPDEYARGIMPFLTVHGVLATNPPTDTSTLPTTDASGNALVDVHSPAVTTLTGIVNDANGTSRGLIDWAIQGNGSTGQLVNTWSQLTWIAPATATIGGNANTNQATNTAVSNIILAKVNVNTASRDVLIAIGLTEGEADSIISYREGSYDPANKSNVAWVLDQITETKTAPPIEIAEGQSVGIGAFLSGTSTVYSAEIVTVSRDGRAFKRVKVIIDATTGTPHIIYRRDMTDGGWPIDPAIREALRSGLPLPEPGSMGSAANNTMNR